MGWAIISVGECHWCCFGPDHFCSSPDLCPGAASSSLSGEEAQEQRAY